MNIKDLKPADSHITKASDFPAMLEKWKGEIANALPKHLNANRMARIALTAFRRIPKLAECDPKSVFAAVIQASQLGLEPDTLGRAYLIPYKVSSKLSNGSWRTHLECQFVPGWKGLVELMNRSGQGSAWTGAVYTGDIFEFELGDSPRVKHVPSGEYTDEKLQYVYAIGRPRGCEWPIIEVWTMERVRAHRNRYNKVGDKHYSYENMEMYARKAVLLQVLKYMPLSPELASTMELSHAADAGNQGLTIENALDGSWVAPIVEPQEPQINGPWVDSSGQAFDKETHAWNDGKQRPSLTSEGVFRARRSTTPKPQPDDSVQPQAKPPISTVQPDE